MLLCGVFRRSNRIHYFHVLLTMRALAMPINVRTYVPKFNNEMHYYYDIVPTAVPWGFCYSKYYSIFVLGQNAADLEIMSSQIFCYQLSHTHVHQDPKNIWKVPFKLQYFARFSLVSHSIHPRLRRRTERIGQGEGRWSRSTEDGPRTKRC